jgi:hypothetical protein
MRVHVYVLLIIFILIVSPADAFRTHFACLMDAAKYSASIAVCLVASVVDHKACFAKMPKAQDYLQDCCNTFANSTGSFGRNIEAACPYFTGGAGEP